MDSYNDDDEVEDENRNPATMQINHSSSVTRAGAQRGFVARTISPTKSKPVIGQDRVSMPSLL